MGKKEKGRPKQVRIKSEKTPLHSSDSAPSSTDAYRKSYKRPHSSESHVNLERPGARTRVLTKAQEAAGKDEDEDEDKDEDEDEVVGVRSPVAADQDSDGNINEADDIDEA